MNTKETVLARGQSTSQCFGKIYHISLPFPPRDDIPRPCRLEVQRHSQQYSHLQRHPSYDCTELIKSCPLQRPKEGARMVPHLILRDSTMAGSPPSLQFTLIRLDKLSRSDPLIPSHPKTTAVMSAEKVKRREALW